jgi:hypothetical protein
MCSRRLLAQIPLALGNGCLSTCDRREWKWREKCQLTKCNGAISGQSRPTTMMKLQRTHTKLRRARSHALISPQPYTTSACSLPSAESEPLTIAWYLCSATSDLEWKTSVIEQTMREIILALAKCYMRKIG